MVEITNGDPLDAQAEALVDVRGRGIALQFKKTLPQMFREYERACLTGEVKVGQMHVVEVGGQETGPRWVINFPTRGRHVRDNLLPAELVIYDILTRPAPELTDAEREEVKKVARQLLRKVQAVLALDWQKRAGPRAQVKGAIAETLDEGLPRSYDKPLYETKVDAVFEQFFEGHGSAA